MLFTLVKTMPFFTAESKSLEHLSQTSNAEFYVFGSCRNAAIIFGSEQVSGAYTVNKGNKKFCAFGFAKTPPLFTAASTTSEKSATNEQYKVLRFRLCRNAAIIFGSEQVSGACTVNEGNKKVCTFGFAKTPPLFTAASKTSEKSRHA